MTWIPDPFHPTRPGLFPTKNIQVTHSSPTESRSESEVVVNPLNPNNLVGASKKFYDPQTYKFYLSTYYTFDGGSTWAESALPLQGNWQGMTDPALTFDRAGNVFLVGEPLVYQNDITGLGMVVYKSTDGGQSWGQPIQLSSSQQDDKQWITADERLESPFFGNIYAIWGANQHCGFARSSDHGNTWQGLGNTSAPAYLANFTVYAPAITTDSQGWVHIFNINPASTSSVQYVRSKDGGATFESPKAVVSGLQGLETLPYVDGFPTFPNGKFRIRTMVTATTGKGQTIIVAWPDTRDGMSRIYYRLSRDGGDNWEGPDSGKSLFPSNVNFGAAQCFMPQLAGTANGTVGCAFYTFGPEEPTNQYLINVFLAASYDDGVTFPYWTAVTDSGWDPLVNAPWSHGDPNLHFIGDYFGIAATDDFFIPFWTDTRTGVQEIFCDSVATKQRNYIHIPDEAAQILFGVTNDGGGLVIVGGKIIKIPPHSPFIKILESIHVVNSAQTIGGAGGFAIERAALNTIKLEVNQMLKSNMKTVQNK